MSEVIFIDPTDRLAARITQRSATEAIKELREATTIIDETLESLATAYPGVEAIASIAYGKARGLFALAPSRMGDYVSPVAPEQLRSLARLIGRLPSQLRNAFEAELNSVPRCDGAPVNFVTADEIAADDKLRG